MSNKNGLGGCNGCSEVIAMNTIQVAGNSKFVVCKGWAVWKITVLSPTIQTVQIGTTPAGDEVIEGQTLTPNVYYSHTQDVLPLGNSNVPLVLFITGVIAYAKINIYTFKL